MQETSICLFTIQLYNFISKTVDNRYSELLISILVVRYQDLFIYLKWLSMREANLLY